MMEIKSKLGRIPARIWVLGIIVILGIFLRTYHFRDWLYFYPDQARDAVIAQEYLEGKTPLPLLGPIAASTKFQIGPIYYYFQIISGKIFGVWPETMAYPDLLFGVLTIPLFYFFLKKYFSSNLSLALTGLFSISFFAVKYSRFAWNSNPIPFFMILFLLSFHEFLMKHEKISWFWIFVAGISLGVGLQLHTILFVLLPVMSVLIFGFLLIKNSSTWKSIISALLIALLLNAGMISSEIKTGFHNTRTLFKITDKGSQNRTSFSDSFVTNVFCHVQANSYIVSSLGDKEDCTFENVLSKQVGFVNSLGRWSVWGIILSIIFSLVGYLFLAYRFWQEKEKRRKYFLLLAVMTVVLSFLVLLTVADSLLLRYFIQLFFVPFLFLGMFFEYIKKYSKYLYLSFAILVFGFLIFSNISTISSEARSLKEGNRSNPKYVVLGEIEPMVDYMIAETSGREAYFTGNNDYFWNFYKPLAYVASEHNFELLRGEKIKNVPEGAELFGLSKNSENVNSMEINGRKATEFKNFGNLGVYKLEN